jgi:hypothetical protein
MVEDWVHDSADTADMAEVMVRAMVVVVELVVAKDLGKVEAVMGRVKVATGVVMVMVGAKGLAKGEAVMVVAKELGKVEAVMVR